ncbi:hypothetical protein PISL3812_09979 [Talaromyces islandicus]|uniref:Uncharacterized protein n=1 Tax=Talaromyces islandicus TaxID=28573 RepID=A0A0U1MC47_TALIS|nr:hypothetical protein PISL3812_09979 [Talaromyces islandicus]
MADIQTKLRKWAQPAKDDDGPPQARRAVLTLNSGGISRIYSQPVRILIGVFPSTHYSEHQAHRKHLLVLTQQISVGLSGVNMTHIPWTPAEEGELLAWVDRHSEFSWEQKAAMYSSYKPRSEGSLRSKVKRLRRGWRRRTGIRKRPIDRDTAAVRRKNAKRQEATREWETHQLHSRSRSCSPSNQQPPTEEPSAPVDTSELPSSHSSVSYASYEPDPTHQRAAPWLFPISFPFSLCQNDDQKHRQHGPESITFRTGCTVFSLPFRLLPQ